MDKRCGILIVSVTIFVLCFVGTAAATNWSVDGSGGADFTGIQDAINKAKDGDTIVVYSDVYYENVVVDKSVTLIGNGHPVVDAGGEGSAITLTADGITLVGFTATNAGSSYVTLVEDEYGAGIKVISSNNVITGNTASNNHGTGIYLRDSSNNTITGNNASNNSGSGIGLPYSSNNTITGNNVSNNDNGGIHLSYSGNNTITGNIFVNDGLYVSSSYQNTVEDNTVNGKPLVYLEEVSNYKVEDAGQIILRNCTNITVENLDLSNTSIGITLRKTENSKISNNTVCNNDLSGIHLYDSCNNNKITGNNASNNDYGIHLYNSCNNNTITGNNVGNNNRDGIELDDSSNNRITGNTFVNDGLSVQSSYQNTVEDNTVNGKPLVYLKDVSDYKVEDAGQVIIVNCNNITIENLDLSYTCVGIALWKTENSKISNNTVCNNSGSGIELDYSSSNNITGNNISNNNERGIYLDVSSNNTIIGNNVNNNDDDGISLDDSSNNKITGNNVSNNDDGISLYYSCNDTIAGNNVRNNNWDGISLFFSSNNNTLTGNNVSNNDDGIYLYDSCNNNTITGNNISNNDDGIYLDCSSNNTIYFNNFINNTDNVDSYRSTIIWNSPFELTYTYDGNTYTNYVGNYWDDYEQTNPDAEEIVTTGIWNTPYGIAGNKDNYPLMEWFENYIISTSAHTELPTPGFELLFAIMGVVAVVYFVRRRG